MGASTDNGGHWVTIEHEHVYIKDDRIAKGPSNLVGKSVSALPHRESNAADKPVQKGSISETPAFKAWFGDSKVVDEKGKPLVVYKGMYPHDYEQEDTKTGYKGPLLDVIGRKSPFPSFDPQDREGVKLAGFFADKPEVAERFMGNKGAVYPCYLKIEKPIVIDAKGQQAKKIQFGPEGKPFRDAIRSGKYDGVIIKNTSDEGNVYIALHSHQIKSAIGNAGTFDPHDARITASRGCPMNAIILSSGLVVPLNLGRAKAAAPELSGGEWRTINGAHVYIKGGSVAAGPHHLMGMKEGDVAAHGKADAKAKPGYHAIERDAVGNYVGTKGADGAVAHNPEHEERLKALKIAPGYSKVHLAEDPQAMRQAYQTDSKGRETRVYSDAHHQKQAAAKFARVKQFVGKLPAIREAIANHPSDEAAALRLIDQTGIRIGSDADTGAEKKAYGASTLRAEHVVTDEQGRTALHFTGKKGVEIHQPIDDPKLAEELKSRAKSGGKLYNTNDAKVRDHLHAIAPGFKVKDFRTAVAADTAMNAMKGIPAPTNLAELVKARKAVGEKVSAKLGNTPAVALKSYIPPEVFSGWETKAANLEQAKLIEAHAAKTGMSSNDAARDWIKNNAAAYRENFNKKLGKSKPGNSAGKSQLARTGEFGELPRRADGRGRGDGRIARGHGRRVIELATGCVIDYLTQPLDLYRPDQPRDSAGRFTADPGGNMRTQIRKHGERADFHERKAGEARAKGNARMADAHAKLAASHRDIAQGLHEEHSLKYGKGPQPREDFVPGKKAAASKPPKDYFDFLEQTKKLKAGSPEYKAKLDEFNAAEKARYEEHAKNSQERVAARDAPIHEATARGKADAEQESQKLASLSPADRAEAHRAAAKGNDAAAFQSAGSLRKGSSGDAAYHRAKAEHHRAEAGKASAESEKPKAAPAYPDVHTMSTDAAYEQGWSEAKNEKPADSASTADKAKYHRDLSNTHQERANAQKGDTPASQSIKAYHLAKAKSHDIKADPHEQKLRAEARAATEPKPSSAPQSSSGHAEIKKFGSYRLSGNTFAAKEDIKAIGGKWDKPSGTWIIRTGGMSQIRQQQYALEKMRKAGVKIEELSRSAIPTNSITLSTGQTVQYLDLSSDEGEWRTINGHHVLIKNGTIVEGGGSHAGKKIGKAIGAHEIKAGDRIHLKPGHAKLYGIDKENPEGEEVIKAGRDRITTHSENFQSKHRGGPDKVDTKIKKENVSHVVRGDTVHPIAHSEWKHFSRNIELSDGQSIDLSSGGDGHWVTIDGAHVFIRGGQIAKGPAGMVGKTPLQAAQHQAGLHYAKARAHEQKAQAAQDAGDHAMASAHMGLAKSHRKLGDAIEAQHTSMTDQDHEQMAEHQNRSPQYRLDKHKAKSEKVEKMTPLRGKPERTNAYRLEKHKAKHEKIEKMAPLQ